MASFKSHLLDVIMHTAGGVMLTVAMVIAWKLTGTVGSVVSIMMMLGLLRELAQANKSDIFAAIASMPSWGWWGHAEWLAWGFGAWLVFAVT